MLKTPTVLSAGDADVKEPDRVPPFPVQGRHRTPVRELDHGTWWLVP